MTPILVSSCLLGLATRYDGSDNFNQAVIDYLQQNRLSAIPVCPEQLAGLPTPRPKCWFCAGTGSDVLAGRGELCDETGADVSKIFLRGAEQSLQLTSLLGCQLAILKERSPSCGSRQVHQNGQLVSGMGVTAALLEAQGIAVFSEERLPPNGG